MASKKAAPAAGDAPAQQTKPAKKGKDVSPEPEEIPKTPSEIAREEAEYRAMMRKQRFKRRWPEITKVKIRTRPWHPPPPPQRMQPIMIERPELTTRRWVPPYRRRRRPRPRLQRIPPEEITQPLYEVAKLNRIWHNFSQVEKNKMMLQGSIGCNSKRYSSSACGSQTACIAVVCKALLEEKPTSSLVKSDVDDCITVGDNFYRRCMVALKCYKGKPQLQLNQLLTSFFLHDTKYTFKLVEVDKGLLAKHPDNIQQQTDLMGLMEKRIGQTYCFILSVGGERHFLVWGHPPTEAAGNVRTIAYIFDPHMLDEYGHPHKLHGAGAFLRYAGITSFVIDFLNNYGDLDAANKASPKPQITLTSVEIVQKEPLERMPNYDLDLKALKIHCRSEWDSININSLIEKKQKQGQYPQCSLSAVSLATSRATSKRKVRDFYQKTPKEPSPTLPVAPERPPPNPTLEQIMSLRGEDFFLYCPKIEGHAFGRDDMIPRPKSETILHSPVEIADKNFHSQYQPVDSDKKILRGTRHMASYRYQTFKSFTGVACCVVALGMLKRYRARAWNEDTLDETLDLGYNYYRESLGERTGPIRRLVLGELKETFKIRDHEYIQKQRGIAVWGKMNSSNPKVFDLCRGLDAFFKESDSGVLQVPGEFEAAIWNEGGVYYLYHPWPADRFGKLVGLRDGGKCCILNFASIIQMCDHLLNSLQEMSRRPFSISDVAVTKRADIPQPLNSLTPVAPGRWVLRGTFHEGDARFPEERRNRQATPMSIVALALSHLRDADEWTPEDVEDVLVKGDTLYQNTMDHLERMGISLEQPKGEDDEGGEEEEEGPTGALAAADVLNKFKISDYDHVETEVTDSAYNGSLNPEPGSGIMSLEKALEQFFKKYSRGVVTARGASIGVWKNQQHLFMFDPHGCDENGYPSSDARAGACVVRVAGGAGPLAAALLANLPAGADDTFNISPVSISASRIHPELDAPETKLESKAFEWISKGTAAIMMGPRGENTAIGKVARKAGIGDWDMAGRSFALPAAAAFVVATDSVPPQYMHQDHMFNFLDSGADYYLNFVKRTGRKEMVPEDLTEKFTLGANTFTLELGEPIRLPLRLPDEPAGEGAEEETAEKELGEEEEEEIEPPMKQIKDALFKVWTDYSKPSAVLLLYGDYHALGVCMSPGGRVVAFDPAPTLSKGALTRQRILKGDELRLQRIKDEMAGEGGDAAEEEDEEVDGEGEEQPEPEPEFVPPESCPALMVFSSPAEFIDKLTLQGGLDRKQCLAPYKLYPVNVINELTSVLKEKKPAPPKTEEGEAAEDEEEEALVDPLEDAAMGAYMTRINRTTASVRGRLAQDEAFFQESQRDMQDAANAIMGIVVEHIEPYTYWKPSLIDAILKYGDRLYTLSSGNMSDPPSLAPHEVIREFHVTNFNVRLDLDGEEVSGDLSAGETGPVLNLRRGINKFFEMHKYGVICCKKYCVGIWRGSDDKSVALWEPHSIGPAGRRSAAGAAGLCLIAAVDQLAETVADNVRGEARPGGNRFTITPVKVFWEYSKSPAPVTAQGAVPDEGYEWKVLTAYVETARGRTILRGTRPPDLQKFTHDTLLQSAASAIVAACMSHVRRPHLWTRNTVDEVLSVGCKLFSASLGALGYEFRPGDDVLLPLQVLKRFVLGVNYVRYDLQQVFSGKLEQKTPTEMTCRAALERFFESHTHGILWSAPHAVAVWRVAGAPAYYMMEPHACGPTGLRIDAQDDGAACVLTFTSPKLMAYAYLQNIPVVERPKHDFQLYAMSVCVQPIKKLGVEPPLVKAPPGAKLVPATSKVGVCGSPRRAAECDRKHPPGSATCGDAQRAAERRDNQQEQLKGQRNTSGWLVLNDGSQFLSAQHSMACKKFPYASRGHQALSCCVMSVAMSRVQDVCRWCGATLDQILESGDQLHQDSYLHFRPSSRILSIHQVLRKFYTPGNCVCRVVVYKARQGGVVDENLFEMVTEFFKEEKCGVFVAGEGDFAVALFRTPRGYYMFDPADRDRYGRAVAPPCWGKGRACFSQYPSVKMLVEKLGPNIPPVPKKDVKETKSDKSIGSKRKSEVKFAEENDEKAMEPAQFAIYGMDVTSLRRLNKHEK